MSVTCVTTSIPYVNGEPHVGFALELVQADVLARHRRLRGDDVRFLTGTDDNALKNVQVAEVEGVPVAELVDRNAARFEALLEPLRISNDDFLRTSVDPRHRMGVERLWQACEADLYERDYEGLYCVRCESFVTAGHEHDGLESVSERNWFFRLSRYQDVLLELIGSGELRIEPAVRRNEVLAFVQGGLDDFSVSRSRTRARGWGLPVPDDPSQIVYVWFDALANYVTALGYGGDDALLGRYWLDASRRVHTIGKDIVRFHAVYWPAILVSAGLPLPTTVWVHDFVLADGARISKSAGGAPGVADAIESLGRDALRWWLLRDVRGGADAEFREELVIERANAELANTIGNLVSRTAALLGRHDVGEPSALGVGLVRTLDDLPGSIDGALERFNFPRASGALVAVAAEANRLLEQTRPWEPSREREAVLGLLERTCRLLGTELEPFLPGAKDRIEAVLAGSGGRVFPRI